MLMVAVVRQVRPHNLLVQDLSTFQEVLVHTRSAQCFHPGDRVRIWYDGTMTQSLPPQITALNIRRICWNGHSCG